MGKYFSCRVADRQYRFAILVLTLCLKLTVSNAQTFNFPSSEQSEKLTAAQLSSHGLPDTITVWCNEWDIMAGSSSWGNNLKLKSNSDFVKFYVDNYYSKSQEPYTYQLAYTVIGFYNNPHTDSVSNTQISDTLTITNFNHGDPHNANQDLAVAHYANFYKMMVIINSISQYTGSLPEPAAVLSDSSRMNFNVEGSILTQRYDKTNYGPTSSLQITRTPNTANNTLKLTFNLPGHTDVPISPVNYELEWTYVDNYVVDPSSGSVTNTGGTYYNFRNNCTKVPLDSPSYTIPLTYPHGTIVYRAMMVRPDSTLFEYPIYSKWSYNTADSGTITGASSSAGSGSDAYTIANAYTNDSLNYQYTVSFAEGGKYKQVASFYDGLLKNRESITRFNSNPNDLIVTKNVYDFEGRPSIKTLPAPVATPAFSFQHGVDLNSVTGTPLQAYDFDTIPAACPEAFHLPALATTALASIYYSSSNPDMAGVQKYVPDAGGYPMIQTIYDPTFNDRVQQQGGAGPYLQMADSNVITNYYITPGQSSLDWLFGLNAGWASYYTQTITRDPNMQLSMTIKDYKGKQMVSSLIGGGGSPVTHAITPTAVPGATYLHQDILYMSPQEIIDDDRIADKDFFNEWEANDSIRYIYTFAPYPLCPGQYLTLKAHYFYDVTDQCGDTLFSQDSTLGVDGVVSTPISFTGSGGVVHLGVASYHVHKVLSISNHDAIAAVDSFFAAPPNCFRDLPWFIRWDVEKRKFPCPANDDNPCDALKAKMIRDLSPGGIYGGYKDSAGIVVGIAPSIFTYYPQTVFYEGGDDGVGGMWVYDTAGGLTPTKYGHNLYQDSCILAGMPDTITINGIKYYPLKSMSADSFIMIYNMALGAGNDSIANALLPLDPEYCQYLACFNDTFKAELQAIPNAQVAQQMNLLYLDSMIAHDPVRTMLGAGGYDSLSTYPGVHTRLDSIELIRDYCGCSDSVMFMECASHMFTSEISHRLLINDYVKNLYFTDMQNMYLFNRQRFINAMMSATDSCSACAAAVLPLVGAGSGIFTTITSGSSGVPTLAFSDSMYSVGDSTGSFILAYLTDSTGSFSADSSVLYDSAVSAYSAMDSELCYGGIDSVVARLDNCAGGNPTVIAGIMSTLDSLCAAHATPEGDYTPDIIRYAILRNGGTLTDMCNPFLIDYSFSTTGTSPGTEGCLTDSFYSSVNYFLDDDSILIAFVYPGTIRHDTLDYLSSLFEYNLWLGVGSHAPVIDYTTYDAVHSLYTLNIITDPGLSLSYSDTVRVYLRSTGSCAEFFHNGASGDSMSVVNVLCSSTIATSLTTGFINEFSFVADVVDFRTGSYCTMLGWADSVRTMTDRNNLIGGCVPCTQMRQLYTQFSDSMAEWGMVGPDHPLYENTMTNYMNYMLGQAYTSDQYDAFIESCALADSVRIPLYVGYANLIFPTVANADSFITMLDRIDTNVSFDDIYRDSTYDSITVCVDLTEPPAWELYRYVNAITAYTVGSPVTLVNAPLSNFQAPQTVGFIFAYPGTAGINTAAIFGSGGTITIVPSGQRGIWMGAGFVLQDYYKVMCTTSTQPYEISRDVYTITSYLYNNGLGASLVSNYESTVDADYFKPEKQDFLRYTYNYEQLPPYGVLDSLQVPYLISRITAYNSDQVSYTEPFNPNVVTNLYLADSTMTNRLFDTLKVILNDVATLNTVSSGAIMFNANKVVIIPSVDSPLIAYRCSDGTYWYRYFTTGDTMFNAYLAMPPWIPQAEQPGYKLISYAPAIIPGLGDSTSRYFNVNMVNSSLGDTIQARGMTTFVIGKNVELDNVLLGQPITATVAAVAPDTFENCERDLLNSAIRQGYVDYDYYYDSMRTAITAGLEAYMMTAPQEQLLLGYYNQEFDFTLYNYDRAGNLMATVPPAGIVMLPTGAISGVDTARSVAAPPTSATMPADKKVSSYNYNTINQVVVQSTPDGGTTNFFYDAAARLISSQNAKQAPNGYCTYNIYDQQNRIIETGQATLTCPYFQDYSDSATGLAMPGCYYSYSPLGGGYPVISPFPPFMRYLANASMDSIVSYIHSIMRTDVVATVYDTAAIRLDTVAGLTAQQNLRKRVACVKYFEALSPADAYYHAYNYATHYSYDIDGNVSLLVQDNPALAYMRGQRFKSVNYDYDLISGKVNMLSYNRSWGDQFFQRYSYDADNRITEVETSNDGYIWKRDAEYQYYEHGPLARTDVGDLRVQGVDFAYTVQGWLKLVNSDSLNSTMDMGGDGSATINATDAVAYAIDYFQNDYKPISSYTSSHVVSEARSLYNGNISRQTMAMENFQRLNKQYVYDQLNRITSASYASVSAAGALTGLPDFHNSYTYDLDGNIQTLLRYGNNTGSGALVMDSLRYRYGTGMDGYTPNELENLTDSAPNNYTNDIPYDTAVTTPTYCYDATGNTTKDLISGQDTIKWNLYNKVTNTANNSASNTMLFDYDGGGNRVAKYVTTTQADSTVCDNDYYTRDAQGNILAIYHEAQTDKSVWISLIHEAHLGALTGGGVSPDVYVALYVAPYFAASLPFHDAVMAYSLANPSFSSVYLSQPPSYFLSSSSLLYNKFVNADEGYLPAMIANEQQGQIIGPALAAMAVANPQSMTGLLHLLLTDTSMELPVLQQLCTAGADSVLDTVASRFGIDTTVACDTLAAMLCSTINPARLAPAIAAAAAIYPTSFALFTEQLATGNAINGNKNYTSPGSAWYGMLRYAISGYANQADVLSFFSSYENTGQMLAHVASNADLLDVAYNTDITGYITAFDSILGDAYLDTAMASEPHRSSARMASAMAGGDPFLHADALTGTSLLWEEDPFGYWDTTLHTHTFSLAEHDIYGSSRLGVRDYFGTQVGLSWNYTAAIYDTVRLWQRLPWYSFEYQDVINDTARSIYGNTLTQKYITQFMRGQKQYELTDHLGDVLATVSDARMPNDTVALHTTGFYQPVEQSQFDYYPFGQYLTGRCLPDTEMHCAVTTETQLVAVTTTTFVPWYYPISPNPYVIVGQGTLQQVGEGGLGGGVIFTGSTEAAELEYSLGTEPAGVPLEVDLDIALSTGSFTAMLVDASNKALATVSVSASQQQAVYRLTATPLSTGTLHIVYCCSGLIPWHEVTYGHWITTTTWETETVVSDVCSEDKYHYGFNGKLKDNQWAGPGNHYDYGDRMYDSRISRWLSRDKLAAKLPTWSPYAHSFDNPTFFIDQGGQYPYNFTIRSFAPSGAFSGFWGMHFDDDHRGYSASSTATSRISQSFTIDPTQHTASGGTPTSSDTRRNGNYVGNATNTTDAGGIGKPSFFKNSSGSDVGAVDSHFEGSNPAGHGLAPNIAVKSSVIISENDRAGYILASVDLSSKQFPATESMVTDAKGQSIWLTGGQAMGNPSDLISADIKQISSVDVRINIDNDGNFKSVEYQGKTYSIGDWNKIQTSQSAGPVSSDGGQGSSGSTNGNSSGNGSSGNSTGGSSTGTGGTGGSSIGGATNTSTGD